MDASLLCSKIHFVCVMLCIKICFKLSTRLQVCVSLSRESSEQYFISHTSKLSQLNSVPEGTNMAWGWRRRTWKLRLIQRYETHNNRTTMTVNKFISSSAFTAGILGIQTRRLCQWASCRHQRKSPPERQEALVNLETTLTVLTGLLQIILLINNYSGLGLFLASISHKYIQLEV